MEQEATLRLDAVMKRTGLSKTSIYRLMAEGRFPRQVRISHKLAVWRESDINAWVKALWGEAA